MATPTPSDIFHSFCSDLLAAADTIDDLFCSSAIAVTAWNNADRPDADVEQAISSLEKRLKITSISSSGSKQPVKILVKNMTDRKRRDFNHCCFRIRKVDFENEGGSFRMKVELVPEQNPGLTDGAAESGGRTEGP